ncbi:hypothetical protein INR49_021622 [Caranx melampygus]|nr:hypothetical protein INR49_021622 [Caranx melampygus]
MKASVGEPGQGGDSSCSDSDSPVESSSCEEEEEEDEDEEEEEEGEEEDPTMFSSKFLSGANPLNAVSSAVNKFGLFGDDGEEDKNQKAPPQQGVKPLGQQQPGAGPGKSPQQQQGPQKSVQGPSMQKSQPPPKQGSPQLQGNGQAGPPNKPGGQQGAPKAGTQPQGQFKGEPQKNQPKGPLQQGSPKPGVQQPETPKASSQQQVPSKTGIQQQGPDTTGAHQQEPSKTGGQGSAKVGQQKTGSQQGSPQVGQKQQGSPKIGQQQQGAPKVPQQQQGSPKVAQQQQGLTKAGQQQQGLRNTIQQQSSDKPGPQQQGPGTPGLSRTGSSSPGTTKATSQSKAVAKSLCPGHEWLCLTCQIQRAQGTSEPPGPPIKKPTPSKVSPAQNQTPSSAAPVKKEMSAPGSPQKMQSASSAKVTAKSEIAKGPESQKQASTAPGQKMTPETRRASGSQKPEQASQTGRKQSSATTAPQQESGGLFGFGSGGKTEATKPQESVTGKMFGFGSSIFSSASTLITSAVQDEPKTTPPVSPKMQTAKETKSPSVQKSEQDKKQEQPQQVKASPAGQPKVDKTPSETQKAATAVSHNAPKADKSTCPICKVVLNKGSKDPPNYNTCTGCKSTVCNQCGFNPMPNVSEDKEWLCLNCQVKRAAGEIEPQKDASSINASAKKSTPAQPTLQKTSAPGSPQRKASTPAAQPAKAEPAKGPDSQKQSSPAHGRKTPQENRKIGPQKQPDQTSQTAQKQGNATTATQQDSGGFFGFGGSKNQTDAAKPAESVTGKMFGFGSSIFSSASTLISTAVQDEPKSTPPVSPKLPVAKDSKYPTAKKPEEQPMAKVKEWLCLNCQMQRALGASEPTGLPLAKPQASPSKVEQKDVPTLDSKEKSTDSTAVKKEVTEATPLKKETQKDEAPQDVAGQPAGKSPQVQPSQTTKPELKAGPEKQDAVKAPVQPPRSPTAPAKSAPPPTQPAKQESGGFFGFGGPKIQPAAAKPAESVTGKMFGFGSSFLSSASTLITSAVQDEPKPTQPSPRKMSTTAPVSPIITPPVSPKLPLAKETKPPAAQKLDPSQQAKPAPSVQAEKAPPEPSKSIEVIQIVPKADRSTCPLCKIELNMGSKDPPNYNTCTECKNTVCNLCGFNPMPHTGVKEWLCLNCQTQRALLGQLGDSGKMPQPSAVSAKLETQVKPTSKMAEAKTAPAKAEPTPVATKTPPTTAPIKILPTDTTPKIGPTSVKMETTPTTASTQFEPEATTGKITLVTEEKQPQAASTAESVIPTMAPEQKTEELPKVEVSTTDVPITLPVDTQEEAAKMEHSVAEVHIAEESKPDLPKVKAETDVAVTSSVPVTDTAVEPPTHIADEEALAGDVPRTETKPEVCAPEAIINEAQPDDHIEMTEATKSLQQEQVQPKTQETQLVLEIEPMIEAGSKEVADKPVKKTIDVTAPPETQTVSTENIIIKDQDAIRTEEIEDTKISFPSEEQVFAVKATEPKSKVDERDEDQPQILPVSQELKDDEVVSDTRKDDIKTRTIMPVKEEVKAERRRLSFQAMNESSESELTPSPSPKVQRRRLEVTNISSSSEDIKTESAGSSVEDEDFIRKQIMGMGDEEEMSLSEDEKEKNLASEEAIKEPELDNALVTDKLLSRKGSADNIDIATKKKDLPKTDTATPQGAPESVPTIFRKAIPVTRQRQSTDEEVESITESLSKGSSSVQASSFTPGSSPTSASSLEEDSDSSPSHRKVSGDKQHRKGKHRQPTQPLPTIEDSSEDEKMNEEEKSRKDRDELRARSQPLSPTEGASSTEDLRRVTVIDETRASVTGPPLDAETCVVTIPTEETFLTGQTDMPPTSVETSTEVPVKKRNVQLHHAPLNLLSALSKALFPIPDLKITQCSSGEEEDDSLAEEYGSNPSVIRFNSTVYTNTSNYIYDPVTSSGLTTITCHNCSSTVK